MSKHANKPMQARGKHPNAAQKELGQLEGLNPEPFCYEATVPTTAPLSYTSCHQATTCIFQQLFICLLQIKWWRCISQACCSRTKAFFLQGNKKCIHSRFFNTVHLSKSVKVLSVVCFKSIHTLSVEVPWWTVSSPPLMFLCVFFFCLFFLNPHNT